jgi:Zn-dependent protease with chaperone function
METSAFDPHRHSLARFKASPTWNATRQAARHHQPSPINTSSTEPQFTLDLGSGIEGCAMRVNGLYGHVRRNDVRSLALFAGFVAAFHVLALLALLVPLAMFDPDHAPLYGWMGYLVRWVPIVTLLGALLFAVQMAWHIRVVRRRTDFRFVEPADEPRLWRIVEPLAIAAGLPRPRVGVIESPALNAFACGVRRKDAVLVFTRGLIDGLDDDELSAVAAHEIAHIVNGDIRLIAATNVCLDTLRLLQRRETKRDANRASRVWEAVNLPVMALLLPLMAVLVVAVTVLRHMAVHGSHLTRLLIASAREFIADAEAVRLTQNPAALVSALQRIEGRSAIPGLAAGQDAMMIDGAHEGLLATHPTIAERIAAIVAVTGSMALIAPARRDTRPPWLRAADAVTRRQIPDPAPWRAARSGAGAALARVSSHDEVNRLGLTREMTLGAVAALGVFLWVHGPGLGKPGGLAAAFDPASLRPLFTAAGRAMTCTFLGTGTLVGLTQMPTDCGEAAMNEMLVPWRGEAGRVGKPADAAARQDGGAAGVFSERSTSPEGKLAEVSRRHCFQTRPYAVGDRGLHSINKQPVRGEMFSLSRWLAHGDAVARRVEDAPPELRDAALLDYFKHRKTHGETIHRHFGAPGLEAASARYAEPAHMNAIERLRQRLADARFASGLSPLERAEIELLAAHPHDFISCTARRERRAQT